MALIKDYFINWGKSHISSSVFIEAEKILDLQ